MEERKYTKLSELVGKEFTVERAYGFQYKKWENESKRMLVSERYEEGYTKVYTVETNYGRLDLRAGQMGNLLEGVVKAGVSDINGKTFLVRSNGKTGMDIRYYINPVRNPKPPAQTAIKEAVVEPDEEPFNLEDIPF